MKDKIKKWLDKLAAANQESFGTERMDCCTLHKGEKVRKSVNTVKKTR